MDAWKPTTELIRAEGFEKVVAAHRIVVVHFWAEWNLYDKTMNEYIEKLRPNYQDIAFFSFDVDPEENWEIGLRYHVRSLPVLLCFIGGKYYDRRIGLDTERVWKIKFDEWREAAKRD